MRLLIAFAIVAAASPAFAQYGGYTINTPGQLPTHVNPTFGGGYTINTPGQLPTQVNPTFGGGYTVNTPGQLPTTITPTFGPRPCCGYSPSIYGR